MQEFLNCCEKCKKHKCAFISLTKGDIERFRWNFRPTGYLRNIIFAIFKKISTPQKWRPFWVFVFLPKMQKHKFASISLTVRDRAILSKFSTHRVSKQCTSGNFQKISTPQKWRPFWVFVFLPKMQKHKFPSISLTVRDRVISAKFSTHRVSQQTTLQFSKKFPLRKNGGHFEFLNCCEKCKNTNLLLSP